MADKKPVGVANVQRRTWDTAEYEAAADARKKELDASAGETAADARKRKRLARDPLHQGVITERAPLRARDEDVDLAADLGKKRSVAAGAAPAGQAGYYCAVCDCVLKDSKGWLDHVNGKWHNRALGMSMRVEKVGVDGVKARLAALKGRAKDKAGGSGEDEDSKIDPESAAGARLAAAKAAEARAAAEAKAKREAKKRAAREAKGEAGEEEEGSEEEDEEAAAMAAAMGFAGFGGGK